MPRRLIGMNVFDAAVERMSALYRDGHRVVVAFSGGKDSGVCLEIALIAARKEKRLPVDVIIRDEEIMFPGTFEYAERVAARAEVNFHWIWAGQPIINVFNRTEPYWWVFDPLVDPEDWVRKPPPIAYKIPELHIGAIVTLERFPPAAGKRLYNTLGLRISESSNRNLGIHSAGGHLTKPNAQGVYGVRPIYDWKDSDVWRAISQNGWDYNTAYDTLNRLGLSAQHLRIAPPTMTRAQARSLPYAAKAWPHWFDRVAKRCPGTRAVATFGFRAVVPGRHLDETWKDVFYRTCVETAPEWVRTRALAVSQTTLKQHARHSATPFPDHVKCHKCHLLGSWRVLSYIMYNGDPFSLTGGGMPEIEPEFFREGAGQWHGRPAF